MKSVKCKVFHTGSNSTPPHPPSVCPGKHLATSVGARKFDMTDKVWSEELPECPRFTLLVKNTFRFGSQQREHTRPSAPCCKQENLRFKKKEEEQEEKTSVKRKNQASRRRRRADCSCSRLCLQPESFPPWQATKRRLA